MRALKGLLENPDVRGLNVDDARTIEVHREIIRRKPLLRDAYASFYGEFVKASRRVPRGPCVEMGSGGGFLKEHLPSVITSDVLDLRHVDMVCSAESLPLGDRSVSAFFLLDVFHHIKNPRKFLAEVQRCLRPRGSLVMIEPANTAWGRLIRKTFHHEPFDETAGWTLNGTGPLSASNLALPWIVFVRDRERFEREFPDLAIVRYEPHTSFLFLLSGGVHYRALVPRRLIPLVKLAERLASPLNGYLGMHVTIEMRKSDRAA